MFQKQVYRKNKKHCDETLISSNFILFTSIWQCLMISTDVLCDNNCRVVCWKCRSYLWWRHRRYRKFASEWRICFWWRAMCIKRYKMIFMLFHIHIDKIHKKTFILFYNIISAFENVTLSHHQLVRKDKLSTVQVLWYIWSI